MKYREALATVGATADWIELPGAWNQGKHTHADDGPDSDEVATIVQDWLASRDSGSRGFRLVCWDLWDVLRTKR